MVTFSGDVVVMKSLKRIRDWFFKSYILS